MHAFLVHHERKFAVGDKTSSLEDQFGLDKGVILIFHEWDLLDGFKLQICLV